MEHTISVKLKIWRQRGPKEKGQFVNYALDNVSTGSSFLEMLDMLNQQLVEKGEEPVVFDNDCREGICGMCSLHIDGRAHGPGDGATTCQIYMRKFKDGATITIEPWRSAAFPVIKDLVVNRSAYDEILQAGGFISCAPTRCPMPTPFLSRRPTPTNRWMPRPASAAVPAQRPARTVRPCFSWQPASRRWPSCPRAV